MPHMREVKTCDRCRHFKRRCDLLKPACSRCVQAGVRCSFESAGPGPPAGPSSSAGAATAITAGIANASLSPSLKYEDGADSQNGLISPSTSAEDADQQRSASISGIAESSALLPDATSATSAAAAAGQRVVRKRKRNCLSCLRCHRLKVKCDKELPCGRCKSSGNGRECYYSYNKGPNGGKFPCPTVPITQPSGSEITKSTQATWHVSHEPRGSSHWKELMTKVCAGSGMFVMSC
jgi:hypothetical protein